MPMFDKDQDMLDLMCRVDEDAPWWFRAAFWLLPRTSQRAWVLNQLWAAQHRRPRSG